MLKIKTKLSCIFIFILLNCSEDKHITNNKIDYEQLDSIYTLNPEYEISDSRRYGVFPNSEMNNSIHKTTQKSKMESLIDFASQYKDTIYFHEGYYNSNLILDSRQNVHFKFDHSGFNLMNITNEEGEESSNILLSGTLILYDKFGTYNSNNIKVDSLIIKSNASKHLSGKKSRGCHIYKGTRNMNIEYLKVEDLASGDSYYHHNHAALSLDGLRDAPQNIVIDEAIIKSSDRHGVFINGENNTIKDLKIYRYAQGTVSGMSKMQGTQPGEESILSGMWINRCNNCFFNKVEIRTKYSDKGIPLKLDEGRTDQPTIINELLLDEPYKDSLVLDDILTNVLVKKITVMDD